MLLLEFIQNYLQWKVKITFEIELNSNFLSQIYIN